MCQGEKDLIGISPHMNGESTEVDSGEEDSDDLEEEDERGAEQPAASPSQDNRIPKEGSSDADSARQVFGCRSSDCERAEGGFLCMGTGQRKRGTNIHSMK